MQLRKSLIELEDTNAGNQVEIQKHDRDVRR
jgi:hypothetical protein